jgi:hypothetical protein
VGVVTWMVRSARGPASINLMCQPGMSRTWLPRSHVPRPFSMIVAVVAMAVDAVNMVNRRITERISTGASARLVITATSLTHSPQKPGLTQISYASHRLQPV